jgi:hypothetical protein
MHSTVVEAPWYPHLPSITHKALGSISTVVKIKINAILEHF